MSIYSVNILSVCLSVMLQKALLLMDVFILVFLKIMISAMIFQEKDIPKKLCYRCLLDNDINAKKV